MYAFLFCIKCRQFAKYSLDRQRYLNHFTPAGERCKCDPVVSFWTSAPGVQKELTTSGGGSAPKITYCPRCGIKLASASYSIVPPHDVEGKNCEGGGVRISNKRVELDDECMEMLKRSRRCSRVIVGSWDYLCEVDIIERPASGRGMWTISCPACGCKTFFGPEEGIILGHYQPKNGSECEASKRQYCEGRFYRRSGPRYVSVQESSPGGDVRTTSKYTFDQSVSVRAIYNGLPGSNRRR